MLTSSALVMMMMMMIDSGRGPTVVYVTEVESICRADYHREICSEASSWLDNLRAFFQECLSFFVEPNVS